MYNLVQRRLHGDLREVFKINKNIDNLDPNKLFTFDRNTRTRGHTLKMYKNKCNLDIRKNFFSNRVIDSWNKLPQYVIDSGSLNIFKKHLDEALGF